MSQSARATELIANSPPVVNPQFPEKIDDFHDAQEVAVALLFHHPNLDEDQVTRPYSSIPDQRS